MPDVYVRLREAGLEDGEPVPADGTVTLSPVHVVDPDAWVTAAATVLRVRDGVAAPVSVSAGRWKVVARSRSWERSWVLDLEDGDAPLNLVSLVPVDPATPAPWLPTEGDLLFIRETRERIPELIEEAVAEGDYTGPEGPPGPAPTVEWDGSVLVVEGERSPDLTGPEGPAPAVSWDGPRLTVGGVTGPDLTGPSGAADYAIVGPGRPDVPASTGDLVTEATPVGATYTSTDGAGVGAFAWRKRPDGSWVVIEGDTGWRDVIGDLRGTAPGVTIEGRLRLRRTPGVVWVFADDLTCSTQGTRIRLIPVSGWEPDIGFTYPGAVMDYGTPMKWQPLYSDTLRFDVPSGGVWLRDLRQYPCTKAWPTILPGNSA